MKNSKQHLTDAFSQLQDAQINLKHALDSAEKLNNKVQQEITKNLPPINVTTKKSQTTIEFEIQL